MPDAIETMLSQFSEHSTPARGLPAGAYTDERFWAAECDTVLAQNWICVSFAHELAEAGDATPVEVAGKPVLLVKNANGEIAAFHNLCRHRCLKLVDQPKNVGKLVCCPYHA